MSPSSGSYFDFDNKTGFRVSQIQFGDAYSWIRGAFLVVASAPVLVKVPPPVGHWNFDQAQSC